MRTKINQNLKFCFSRFEFSQEQFVDLCILLGCDYVDKIKGVGPKKAIELVSSCFYTYFVVLLLPYLRTGEKAQEH